ncbi:MAG TPA: FAD-dependent oxidoreductase [Methanomassiliicoccales archaeon]|nr:FAD-dependent oxidoreductase [Methanomassiliicoccales archaeon]
MSGSKSAIVIGGGLAGMRAALALADSGVSATLVEEKPFLGGRVRSASAVFPSMKPGKDLVASLEAKVRGEPHIEIMTGTTAVGARRQRDGFEIAIGSLSDTSNLTAGAVVLATGMVPVDARQIPELGLGRFEDVIIAEELESVLVEGERNGELLRPSDGKPVKTIAFVQCVGSRVEKRGVPYCSAVCCGNAIKNAMLAKGIDHALSAYIFYIDVRTEDKGCERMYKRARQAGVRFVRGQPSMVTKQPKSDRLLVCGENTLEQELYEVPADLVVLNVGLQLSTITSKIMAGLGVALDEEGLPLTGLEDSVRTSVPGVFVAGCSEAPKDARHSIAQGALAGAEAAKHISAEKAEV